MYEKELVKKADHSCEKFLKFFRIYQKCEKFLKLLENCSYFDVPKACNLTFLLRILISSRERSSAIFLSKKLRKGNRFPLFGQTCTEKFSAQAENFLGTRFPGSGSLCSSDYPKCGMGIEI